MTSSPVRTVGHQNPLHATFYGISEPEPGSQWNALFDATWPAYRAWYLSEGDDARPSLDEARSRLERHMPELVPTWERLVELTGQDETAARMLTLWNPPAFLPGCSQAVLPGEEPILVRNYDYHPDLCERVVYSSAFTGRRVIGSGDCLWGLLDGMNDAGLTVSLTFGGQPGSGEGFGIPLVVRYLLEVCESVDEVRAALTGLPVNMAYNLTVLDAAGEVATFYVAPGAEPQMSNDRVATNHRGDVPDWPEHAARYASVERRHALLDLVDDRPDADDFVDSFLQRPLYNTAYDEGFGTMYTAVYRPHEGVVDFVWPDSIWRRSFDSPSGTHTISLGGWATGHDGPMTDDPASLDAPAELASLPPHELAAMAERAVRALSHSRDPDAFPQLLWLSQRVGESLGVSARTLAEANSWSWVADHAGTSRQAAWSRWREH